MRELSWITLYDQNNNPILYVKLSERGYEAYKDGKKWDHRWVEIMMDINLIKLAEF